MLTLCLWSGVLSHPLYNELQDFLAEVLSDVYADQSIESKY